MFGPHFIDCLRLRDLPAVNADPPGTEYLKAIQRLLELCDATPTPVQKLNGSNPRLADWPHTDIQ